MRSILIIEKLLFGGEVDTAFREKVEELTGKPTVVGSINKKKIDGKNIIDLNLLKGLSEEYYIVVPWLEYSKVNWDRIKNAGYEELTDFLWEKHDYLKYPEDKELIAKYGNKIIGEVPKGISVYFRGCNTTVTFGKNIKVLSKTRLVVTSNNEIKFGNNVTIKHVKLSFKNNTRMTVGNNAILMGFAHINTGSVLEIGDRVKIAERVRILTGINNKITIGKDSQIGSDSMLLGSQGHTIYDMDKKTFTNNMNMSCNITLKDHVWHGCNSYVYLGVTIGTGSIVGFCTMVLKDIPNNCMAFGSPARIIKKNIAWDYDNDIESYESIMNLDSEYRRMTREK